MDKDWVRRELQRLRASAHGASNNNGPAATATATAAAPATSTASNHVYTSTTVDVDVDVGGGGSGHGAGVTSQPLSPPSTRKLIPRAVMQLFSLTDCELPPTAALYGVTSLASPPGHSSHLEPDATASVLNLSHAPIAAVTPPMPASAVRSHALEPEPHSPSASSIAGAAIASASVNGDYADLGHEAAPSSSYTTALGDPRRTIQRLRAEAELLRSSAHVAAREAKRVKLEAAQQVKELQGELAVRVHIPPTIFSRKVEITNRPTSSPPRLCNASLRTVSAL